MPINPDAVGYTSEPHEASWNSKDCLLYALGVGAGVIDPTGFELEFTTENSQDVTQRVLPTFPVVVAGGGRRGVRQDRHVQPGHARPRGAVGEAARSAAGRRHGRIGHDDHGHLRQGLRGGGRDQHRRHRHLDPASPLDHHDVRVHPGRRRLGWRPGTLELGRRSRNATPTTRSPTSTRPDQALLYRLSGDRNPLHSDPKFAAMGGFDRPILHGLCTFGFTGRALLHTLCGSDPDRFVSMAARFSKPVFPGEELTVSMWVTGDELGHVPDRDAEAAWSSTPVGSSFGRRPAAQLLCSDSGAIPVSAMTDSFTKILAPSTRSASGDGVGGATPRAPSVDHPVRVPGWRRSAASPRRR